jgi:hypothetical protein
MATSSSALNTGDGNGTMMDTFLEGALMRPARFDA